MTKSQKKNWLIALRSGKFKQTKHELRKVNNGEYSYCCLGVARLVCKVKGNRENSLLRYTFLPKEVQQKLADLNDGFGWSFKKIANYIEKFVPATA